MTSKIEGIITKPTDDQIWQEVDPRFERFVRIICVHSDGTVGIETVEQCSVGWKRKKGSRESWVKPERFNSKRGGYRHVE